MLLFFTLILFGSSGQAAAACYRVKLVGSLIERDKSLYFVTHRQSQEEKNWLVQVASPEKKIELLAYAEKFTEVEGILSEDKIIVKKIHYSAEAVQNSRKILAVQRGEIVPCSF